MLMLVSGATMLIIREACTDIYSYEGANLTSRLVAFLYVQMCNQESWLSFQVLIIFSDELMLHDTLLRRLQRPTL